MTPRFAILLLAASLLCGLTDVQAAGIDDCEKIKDADSYNRCLAGFGPVRGERTKAQPGGDPEFKGKASQRQRYGRGKAKPQTGVTRHGGGRMRMIFEPGRKRR